MCQITKATFFGMNSLVRTFWLISSEFNHWIQAAAFIKNWTATHRLQLHACKNKKNSWNEIEIK